MTQPQDVTTRTRPASLRTRMLMLRQILFILVFLASSVGGSFTPARAEAAWSAYNDCALLSGQIQTNITTINCYSSANNQTLKNFANGSSLPDVRLSVQVSGAAQQDADRSGDVNPGTDAYNTFNGKTNMVGGVRLSGSGSYVNLIFSGLDPAKTYAFATTANRDNADYTDRRTKFTLQDAEGAVNASTSGVEISTTSFENDTSIFLTGYNTETGYVARWTGIRPGTDGDFTVNFTRVGNAEAYGPAVFLLQEESGSAPAISLSGLPLKEFRVQVGGPSAEQVYTVSGVNLSEDVTLAAPAGFELSTTSGSGFGASLVLPQEGGSLASTPVYVRFNPSAEGASSGQITHTSAGTNEPAVAVSGTALPVIGSWVAYNDANPFSGDDNAPNVTEHSYATTSGVLVDYASGTPLPVTVSGACLGAACDDDFEDYGAQTDSGTDAADAFGPAGAVIVDLQNMVQINEPEYSDVITFNNLNPAKSYTITLSANRDEPDYAGARYTRVTLLGAQTYANTSSAGVVVHGEDSVSFETGYNTEKGYVARWTGITSGPDGSFSIQSEWNDDLGSGSSNSKAYAMNAFRLEESDDLPPQFTLAVSTTGSGSVTLNPPGGLYFQGSHVTLTPVPAPGWTFTGWSGLDAGDLDDLGDGSWEIVVDAAREVTAEFSDAIGTLTFQQGLNGYSGTQDTYLMQAEPSSAFGEAEVVEWDTQTTYNQANTQAFALLRFEDIFGPGANQVPPGASILSAVLTYRVVNEGDPAEVNLALVDWSEAETWNGFGGEAGVQADEYGASAGTATGTPTGTYTLDVTASLSAWSLDPSSNRGWIFRPTDSNGVEAASSEAAALGDRPRLEVIYATGPVNHAPDLPALVRPAQGATVTGSSAILEVQAGDPDGDTLSVSFYGRELDDTVTPGEDFTLVALPDTQMYVTNASYAPIFTQQTEWIAANQTAENIVFVTHLGDIVNYGNDEAEYQRAGASMDVLDAAGVPYSVGPGNHDSMFGTSLYDNYFGVSRFEGKPWYGGHYGSSNYNNYSLFSASGNDFILINLQYNPDPAHLDWADALLKAHPERRGIVVSHNILNVNDGWSNQGIFTALKDNPNLFLMLCGHNHGSNDGAAYRSELGDDGHTIHIMLADYQEFPNGGNGWLRLLRFSPADSKIYATTYSPYLEQFRTSHPDEMEMVYDMAGESGGPFELLGTVNNVASGGTAAFTWGGLSPGAGYEWYAVVEDGGGLETRGPDWSFSTESAGNHAPVITQGDTTSVSMAEDGAPTPFSLTLNATDADGDLLTWSIAAPASHGAASASGAGNSISAGYLPVTHYFGSDSFSVQVADGKGGVDSITVQVTITPINDRPVAHAQAVSGLKDQPQAITLSGEDIEPGPLTFAIGGEPEHGALSGAPPAVTYTPDSGYTGEDSFTFTVSDGELTSAPAQVSISIGNNPPVLSPIGAKAVNEGSELAFTASAADLDPLTFSLEGAPAGAAITPAGAFTWTPGEAQGPAEYTFTVRVCDDGSPALCDSEAVTVSVAEVNVAPVLAAVGGRSVDEGDLLSFTAEASDADLPANSLTFSLQGAPAGAAITSGGSFIWTPTEAQGPGEYTFSVRVCDGGSPALCDSETISVSVAEVNGAPVLAAVGDRTVDEGDLLSFTAAASDPDLPANSLTFSLLEAPEGAAITPAGAFSWTPSEAQGPDEHTFTVKVCDGGGLCDEEAVTVSVAEVNDAPVLAAVGGRTVEEHNTLTFTAAATDPDLPANSLIFSLEGMPAGASITPTGNFTWTPAEAQGPGSYTFTVRVCDGGDPQRCDSETITVSVTEVNLAPVLAAVGDRSVDELVAQAFNVIASDADLPANSLTFSLEGAPEGAAITEGGSFTWTPAEAQGPGEYTFTVRVCDGGGLCDEEELTFSVAEVNRAPVLEGIGDQTVAELDTLAFTAAASDADLPANSLTFSLEGAPEGAAITEDGSFTWTPTEAQGPGSYAFRVRVCDDGSPVMCDEEEITVAVSMDNLTPVLAAIGDRSVDELDTLAFTASATDGDLPPQALTFSLLNAPEGAAISADGSFSWTPTEAQGPEEYYFTVRVCDDGEPALCDNEAVTVSVNEVNLAPALAAVGDRSVDEEDLLSFTASAADADLPANALVFELVDAPAGADITEQGAFTWTPYETQGPGEYTFGVRVCDEGGLCDSEEITVSVAEVNSAPALAAVGGWTVDEGDLLSFTATANDADLPANALVFVLEGVVPEGASITPAGSFTWTPSEAQGPGEYTFIVKVCDQDELCDEEEITVSVAEVNSAPVLAEIPAQNATEGAPLTFTASATDGDLPANVLVFSLASGAPEGAEIHPQSGVFTWTPSTAQSPGDYTVTVEVTDDYGVKDSQQVNIRVVLAAAPPEARDLTFNVDEDGVLEGALDASDPNEDPLSFELVTGPQHGTLALENNGEFSYLPAENYHGSDSFTYRASDGELDSETATVSITVRPVNDAPAAAGESYTVEMDGELAVTAEEGLLANDSDEEDDSLEAVLVEGPEQGVLVLNKDGSFTFTPEQGFTGAVTFTYRVFDGQAYSAAVTVTIEVTGSGGTQPLNLFLPFITGEE